MPKVHVLASKGKSITSQPIKWRQWGFPYTHIAYCFDLSNPDDPYVIEAWWNGVRCGKFSQVHTPGTEFAVYSVEVTKEQREKIRDFLYKQIGKPYDWLGILGFILLNPNIESKDRWFCSELVFAAFKQAGIELLKNTHPSEVSPRLFLKSPLLKFEYSTKLPGVKHGISRSTPEGSTA
ncbi:Permuted papain-like amidase enzyme, YaeF/YiiX, C92 family [Balnearium lithotrophicum]|uniref:Permuted papain-like amidase enzyme, YaeF/YiiX, C92 family n=1 Tax=Balnearium lithotrophicum TaxID=223788 RepID=A0A521DZ30_9BACT|nr:YiiX/YebB-like N1pC/P60 family cysteine hydrolase [Balnearium lithotrophicum]SMO76130.1 Permuted papain-like amidase enzyme, YaeF/YiiX, C92 family [Balnearium lithotrophicum]